MDILAYLVFSEYDVAYTHMSYYEGLRQLWTLRYLKCSSTGLTATLMVLLGGVLGERLCTGNAIVLQEHNVVDDPILGVG